MRASEHKWQKKVKLESNSNDSSLKDHIFIWFSFRYLFLRLSIINKYKYNKIII